MNNSSRPPDDWEPCQPGFLSAISQQAKARRRRRAALFAGPAAVAVLAAVVVGGWGTGLWFAPQENYFGGIACHEVQENLARFVAHNLPEELTQRVEAHLRECPACQKLLQQMQNNQAATAPYHDRWVGDWLCRLHSRPILGRLPGRHDAAGNRRQLEPGQDGRAMYHAETVARASELHAGHRTPVSRIGHAFQMEAATSTANPA